MTGTACSADIQWMALPILRPSIRASKPASLAIVQRHAGPLSAADISERPSCGGRYIALTYTIRAESRAQLDSIYLDLTASGVVLIAL